MGSILPPAPVTVLSSTRDVQMVSSISHAWELEKCGFPFPLSHQGMWLRDG